MLKPHFTKGDYSSPSWILHPYMKNMLFFTVALQMLKVAGKEMCLWREVSETSKSASIHVIANHMHSVNAGLRSNQEVKSVESRSGTARWNSEQRFICKKFTQGHRAVIWARMQQPSKGTETPDGLLTTISQSSCIFTADWSHVTQIFKNTWGNWA